VQHFAAAYTPTFTINTDGQNAATVTVAAIIPNSDINFVASLASNTTA
jgi:hypothetical protein